MEQKCFESIFDAGILSMMLVTEPDRSNVADARLEIDQRIHDLNANKTVSGSWEDSTRLP